MKCLVTGGSGFIGSHIVDRLIEVGHEPRIFDLRHSAYAPECDHFVGSILDLEALRQAMNGVHAVFHLAAIADVRDVFADPVYAENVNVRGTVNVLEAARRASVGRVVYGSTTWVYGGSFPEVVDEDTPIQPPDHIYTATKLASEYYCRAYSNLYHLKCTVLRYGIPYGPRSRAGTVVHNFVGKILRGEPIIIDGDGLQYRQFVYVKDLALGNVLALCGAAADRTYNLDGAKKITIREIAEAVCSLMGGGEIRFGPPRTGDFAGKTVISTRAHSELGWSPQTPFRDGLKEYIAWRMENADAA